MTAPYFVLEQEPAPEIEPAERNKLFREIRKLDGMPRITAKTTRVRRFDLTFYNDVELFELSDRQWRPEGVRLCFLREGESLHRLAGTSPPIHEVNAQADLEVTRQNVLEYLAFFCFFVRGDEGPFLIVDRSDNPFVPEEVSTERIDQLLRPPAIWGQDENGDWRVSATVYYSDVIFFADFLVHLSGMIEMKDDWPITGDLEARVFAPLTVESELDS